MKKKDVYLSFRFEGSNEIGLSEFSRFLQKSNKYINAIKSDLGENFKLQNNVVAIEKGSFIVDIIPEVTPILSLLPSVIENTSNFMSIIVSYLEMKDFLKGKPPAKIDGTTVTNYYGEVKNFNANTINIFVGGNEKTAEAASDMVKSIPKGRKLEIYDNNKNNFISIDDNNKKYFDNTAKEDIEELVNFSNGINVVIRKPSLDMKSKWTVYWDKSIDVAIEDVDFSEKVQKSQISFANNEKLKVDLKIISYPNNPEMKPQYIVTKVYSDKENMKLQNLEFKFD